MTLFLGRDITKGKWLEWQLQAYCIQEARRAGYFIEGDQNQGKRSFAAASRAKACGMQAGTADVRAYLYPAKFVAIELKKTNNDLSQEQIEWHDTMKWNGFETFKVYADTPFDCWRQVKQVLEWCENGNV